MSKVKTVWIILMENHNWTGNNAGAAFGAPDIKGNPLAPYVNGTLLNTSAHAEQYFNPPGNHPSQPNYLWLEAETNFGVLADTQPGQPQLTTDAHLVRLLENAGISWKAYAEPDFGSPVFDVCPIDFTFLDVEHLAFVYFNDVNDGLNPQSAECITDVRIKDVGTDPHEAQDFIDRKADTGDLNKGRVSAGEGLDLVTKAIGAKYYDKMGFSPEKRIEWNGFHAPSDPAVRAIPFYKARPLNGIWAVAPYLHNGSVPNLYLLLSRRTDRPDTFWRSRIPPALFQRQKKCNGLCFRERIA